jgi:peptidyl-prolyl cis-trans isomerase D
VFWDEREVGDVSPLFDIGGKLLVVSYIGGTEPSDDIPMDQINDHLNMRAINENKADYYRDQIDELATDDIYAIAQTFDVKVDTVDNMTFTSRNLPGFGTENNVLGHLFAMNEGENSGALEGNGALFIIELDNISIAPALDDYSTFSNRKRTNFNSYINNNYMYRSLENNAEIKDYRRYFY